MHREGGLNLGVANPIARTVALNRAESKGLFPILLWWVGAEEFVCLASVRDGRPCQPWHGVHNHHDVGGKKLIFVVSLIHGRLPPLVDDLDE